MEILLLGIGIVIGLLLGIIKSDSAEIKEKVKGLIESHGKAQFFEPVRPEEAFKESENIDDFLNKLK